MSERCIKVINRAAVLEGGDVNFQSVEVYGKYDLPLKDLAPRAKNACRGCKPLKAFCAALLAGAKQPEDFSIQEGEITVSCFPNDLGAEMQGTIKTIGPEGEFYMCSDFSRRWVKCRFSRECNESG